MKYQQITTEERYTLSAYKKQGLPIAQIAKLMGNHEFNAIGFHTPCPCVDGNWLRSRSEKNTNQHSAYLEESYMPENKDKHHKVLDFFKSLPLWLDLGDLRVIHACWSKKAMDKISPLLNKDNSLTESTIYEGHLLAGLTS